MNGKLQLKKETLLRITNEEVDQVVGGIRYTWTCGHTDACVATTPYRGCDTVKTDCCE